MSTKNVQFAVSVHIAAVLGYHYGKDVTSARLALSVNAEPTFVRRSISKLAKAGLVKATRGKNGACTLAKRPEHISMLDIYLASEAPASLSGHGYPIEYACPISINIKDTIGAVLDDAQAGFEARLARHSLAEVVADIKNMENKKANHAAIA